MNTATVSTVSAHLKYYIKESKEEPVVIVEDGEPVAVLLCVSGKDDLERLTLAYNPRFRELIEDADKRVKQTGGIKHNDFWESFEESESVTDESNKTERT